MKTDRELLEMAAKAAGYTTNHPWNAERLQMTPPVNALLIYKNGELAGTGWNPLTEDGDALRLAVKLRMRIATPTTDTDCAIAGFGDVRGVHVKAYSEDAITDIYAATRRAIVRAAAEIGAKP